MSLSKPTNGNTKIRPKFSAPWFYYHLTTIQSGTAVVFTTFLATHLSATALATVGGIELTNKTIVLGRVYYQNRFLEPVIVFGSLWGHVLAGIAKGIIRLYWKRKVRDQRKLTGDVHEKVEKIITDETDDKGVVVRQKITTRITTTTTDSHISRAIGLILPYHRETGYLLIPLVLGHAFVARGLPRRYFGDSSLIDATYITLALKRWPRSTYLALTVLVTLGVFHAVSGAPAVFKILKSVLSKKGVEKQPGLSEAAKRRQRIIRNGVIVSTVGLLTAGILVIGGKIGRNDIRIPLRTEYLRVYGQIYPKNWVN
ncbi:5793_t:CDS:1 [Acaulospora colombiana]|uniref:5793_t:CDS:1 n=1 Tax=Acaulospora colombiana TaxID=27376 RepID=A0ACA9LY38_9GLOM|nr:5793_t:CDS:1 [Acaulospora colombiana]